MITSEPEKVKRSGKKERKEAIREKIENLSGRLGIYRMKREAEMNFCGPRTARSVKEIKIYGNRVFFFS